MSTFVFESPLCEIRITVVADTRAEASLELGDRIMQLEDMGVRLTHANFELISAY